MNVFDTLYINEGVRHDNGVQFPLLQFNHTASFDSTDAFLFIGTQDTLKLTLVNSHHRPLTIRFESWGMQVSVPASGSSSITLPPIPAGPCRVYADEPWAAYLGLSTLIVVSPMPMHEAIWNMRDQEKALNQHAMQQGTLDSSGFLADFFTINSKTHPETTTDTMATLVGHVGDTILIHLLNSGMSVFPIHFHGYHVLIKSSTKPNRQVGWLKDSFPVRPGECVTVMLVPHQPGMFPVHNHNLTTVTRGGNYPGGMMAMLHIMP